MRFAPYLHDAVLAPEEPGGAEIARARDLVGDGVLDVPPRRALFGLRFFRATLHW